MARASKQLQTIELMKKELAARAGKQQDRLGTGGDGGNYISTKGKKFTYQDSDLGETMPVIILEYCPEHVWYDTPYVEGETNIPACFAVDIVSPDELVPHKDAPNKQSLTCEGCEKNEFGSSVTGRGKACGNYWRLAVVAENDIKGNIAMVRVSSTGFAGYRKYVRGLFNKYETIPLGVVTQLSFMEDSAQPVVEAEFVRELKAAEMGAAMARQEEAGEFLVRHGYSVTDYESPQKSKGARRPGSKKTTKKNSKKRGKI